MNAILLKLEAHTKLGPTYAARLLGTKYPTYAQYRSGRRTLPRYHAQHIRVLMSLPADTLAVIIQEHVYDHPR